MLSLVNMLAAYHHRRQKAHTFTLGGGHAAVVAPRTSSKDCDYIGQNTSRRYGYLIPIYLSRAKLPAIPPSAVVLTVAVAAAVNNAW
jgi:hypothetical protein